MVSLARFWRQCDRAVLAQPLVTAVPGGESAPLTRAALGIDDSACVPFARRVLLLPLKLLPGAQFRAVLL